MRTHDNDQRPEQVDYVVLTANKNETKAAQGIFRPKHESQEGIINYRWGTIRTHSGQDRTVILVSLNDKLGNVAAATMTQTIANTFHPSYIVIIGTAGGFVGMNTTGKHLKPGDIFVPTFVNYGTIKEGTVRESALCQPNSGLLNCASSVGSKRRWKRYLPAKHKEKLARTSIYAEHGGLISTEQILQGTDSLANDIMEKRPKILAADMEAGGAASALHDICASRKTYPPSYLVVKGISDPIKKGQQRNQSQRNQWSPYASTISAAFALDVIRSYEIPRQPTPITRLFPLDGSLEDKLHVNKECSGVLYGVDPAAYSALAVDRLRCLESDRPATASTFFTVCAFDPQQLWNLLREEYIRDMNNTAPSESDLLDYAKRRFPHFDEFQSVAKRHKRQTGHPCVRVLLLQDLSRWNKDISASYWRFFEKLNGGVPCWVTDRKLCRDVRFKTDYVLIGERLLLDYYDDSRQLIVTNIHTKAMQLYYFELRKRFLAWTRDGGHLFRDLKELLEELDSASEQVPAGSTGNP